METQELTTVPAMLGLYAKAVLPKSRAGSPVPDRRLILRDVPPDPTRLRRFAAVCGYATQPTPGAPLPATYPHIVAFPLAMRLMTSRDFPFPLLGLVHLTNRVEQIRPLGQDERLTYEVHAEQPVPHPRGRTFDIVAEARDADADIAWRSISTYLHRGKPEPALTPTSPGKTQPSPPTPPDLTTAPRQDPWRVPSSTGRAYAAVSGDRNPIHLHPLTARPFGFPRAIAHGMWTKTRCLAALADELPDAYAVDVSFRAPLLLPASVRFRARPTDTGAWSFDVRGTSPEVRGHPREHLSGTVSPFGALGGPA